MTLKISIAIFLMLSACARIAPKPKLVEELSPQVIAEGVVANYVRDGGSSLTPNRSTYQNIGVLNADSLLILQLNAHLLGLKIEDVDTNQKIVAIAELFQDFDGDGLSDFKDADDDGDGYADGYELSVNKDPLDPISNPGSTPFIFTVRISKEEDCKDKDYEDDDDGPMQRCTAPFWVVDKLTLKAAPNVKYNYNVDCQSDGVLEAEGITGDYTCVYTDIGRYRVSIYDATGTRDGFPVFRSEGSSIVGVNQWGTGKWTSMERFFVGSGETPEEPHALDAPDLSNVESMAGMFASSIFTQDIGHWETSSVRDMSRMFASTRFNGDISNWDTSNVINMSEMFSNASYFNQDISRWNTSSVLGMRAMFECQNGRCAFDQDLGNWNTGNVRNMSKMFFDSKFNSYIGTWDTSHVVTMKSMFEKSQFNQYIGEWDTGHVNDMSGMFAQSAFNQSIEGWNTSHVKTMSRMFRGALAFNQNLGAWDTSHVRDMSAMFSRTPVFNGNISSWDTRRVASMNSMFTKAKVFNRDIGGWNTSSVTDMARMFEEAPVFNQRIGEWDVLNVTVMTRMFLSASAFNQTIGKWDVGHVTDMREMFRNAKAFNQNIGKWDTHNVISFVNMFRSASSFANQDLSGWDVSFFDYLGERDHNNFLKDAGPGNKDCLWKGKK